MKTPSPLHEITSELSGEFGSRPIARQRVLEWMGTDDIECIGALHSLITDHYDRIQPRSCSTHTCICTVDRRRWPKGTEPWTSAGPSRRCYVLINAATTGVVSGTGPTPFNL
jgi:hypothetical protein